MKKIMLFLCCVFLISCKKDIETISAQSGSVEMENDTIKTNKLLTLRDASDFTEIWPSLLDFENELVNVGKDKINSEKQLEQLLGLLGELKKNTPEKFNKPGINARVIVLETELLLMNQFVKEQNKNETSNQYLKLQKAYNVLINQLEALLIKEKDYEKYK